MSTFLIFILALIVFIPDILIAQGMKLALPKTVKDMTISFCTYGVKAVALGLILIFH